MGGLKKLNLFPFLYVLLVPPLFLRLVRILSIFLVFSLFFWGGCGKRICPEKSGGRPFPIPLSTRPAAIAERFVSEFFGCFPADFCVCSWRLFPGGFSRFLPPAEVPPLPRQRATLSPILSRHCSGFARPSANPPARLFFVCGCAARTLRFYRRRRCEGRCRAVRHEPFARGPPTYGKGAQLPPCAFASLAGPAVRPGRNAAGGGGRIIFRGCRLSAGPGSGAGFPHSAGCLRRAAPSASQADDSGAATAGVPCRRALPLTPSSLPALAGWIPATEASRPPRPR